MKQVIVVNQALNLPPGKLAAQVAHAAVGGLLRAPREQQMGWLDVGMPKVVLRCESEAALLALADDLREVRTICHCGRKATMVVRQDEQGRALREGAQVQIGGNETYVSLCRRHWRAAMGDTA